LQYTLGIFSRFSLLLYILPSENFCQFSALLVNFLTYISDFRLISDLFPIFINCRISEFFLSNFIFFVQFQIFVKFKYFGKFQIFLSNFIFLSNLSILANFKFFLSNFRFFVQFQIFVNFLKNIIHRHERFFW